MEFDKKLYETDVLVLGSGASGCGAAIAARRAGAEVLMVDKGRLESSGNLGGGNDHFMAVLDVDEHDGYEDLADYWATPVTGMTRGVVRNMYESMKPCISILEEAGLEFKHNPDGSYMRSVGFGQPGAYPGGKFFLTLSRDEANYAVQRIFNGGILPLVGRDEHVGHDPDTFGSGCCQLLNRVIVNFQCLSRELCQTVRYDCSGIALPCVLSSDRDRQAGKQQ